MNLRFQVSRVHSFTEFLHHFKVTAVMAVVFNTLAVVSYRKTE